MSKLCDVLYRNGRNQLSNIGKMNSWMRGWMKARNDNTILYNMIQLYLILSSFQSSEVHVRPYGMI